jgi:hypothetical protein
MADTPKLQVGDEVRVFDVNAHRNDTDEGWPGKVEKIARVLVYINYRGHVGTFRLDTRQDNKDFQRRFTTVAEADALRLRAIATRDLRGAGVDIHRAKLTDDQVQTLAALVRSFTEEEKTHG